MAARDIKYGNDLFKVIEKPDSDAYFEATFWDVWIAIVLDKRFDNKWEGLISHFRKNQENHRKNNLEAMISHINHLHDELLDKALPSTDIIADLDDDFLKKQAIKADKKIVQLSFQDKEKSDWMHRTPRKIFFEDALQGNWDFLPIDPQKQAEALRKKFKKKTHYNKEQTFALEGKLTAYIEKTEKTATPPKLFALYRAFLTVILENIDNIDDSYGYIGNLSAGIFEKYLKLDWRELPLNAKEYFSDIIKYVIWEDYGLTDEAYPLMFENLTKQEIKEAELILQAERKKLNEHYLNYQADNALAMLTALSKKN